MATGQDTDGIGETGQHRPQAGSQEQGAEERELVARTHYHVTIGSQGGYMPDESCVFLSFKAARAFAYSEAREIAGLLDPDVPTPGRISGGSGSYAITGGHAYPALGTVIETSPCRASDCADDLGFGE